MMMTRRSTGLSERSLAVGKSLFVSQMRAPSKVWAAAPAPAAAAHNPSRGRGQTVQFCTAASTGLLYDGDQEGEDEEPHHFRGIMRHIRRGHSCRRKAKLERDLEARSAAQPVRCDSGAEERHAEDRAPGAEDSYHGGNGREARRDYR